MVTPVKPMGEVHITMDVTLLNKCVILSHFPMPVTEHLFLETKGCKYFTILDLLKAFHNTELQPDSWPQMLLRLHQYPRP